jgi:hypothetical protein
MGWKGGAAGVRQTVLGTPCPAPTHDVLPLDTICTYLRFGGMGQ